MILLVLAFVLGVIPGVVAFRLGGGPHVEGARNTGPPDASLAEIATLRDGAVGATRWAFAALVLRLAREGHCTLVRTRRRRWLRTRPAIAVDLHADPTALSAFEQTVLRQLGRHDTLDGFGFAGSTFRRRTLREVRADLVARGWLADRRRRSNGCLTLGIALLGVGVLGPAAGVSPLVGAAGAGLGVGGLIAAGIRYPLTETGAQRRAAHRTYAETQSERIRTLLASRPGEAAACLVEALPSLVLERIATPRWLRAVADRFEDAPDEGPEPDWLRDEVDGLDTFADACRTLGAVVAALVVLRN